MMRFLRPSLLCLPLSWAALLATPAAAAEGWSFDESARGVGATVCPVLDDRTGNYRCFALICEVRGGPADLMVEFAGGELPGGPYGLEVHVDGDLAGRLDLTETVTDGTTRLHTPYDPKRHDGLLDRLRAGNQAILKLTHAGQAIFDGVSLRGSSRALGLATEACGTDAPVPAAGGGTGLSAEEVRAEILGHRLYWGDDLNGVGTVYLPGGRFEGMMVTDGRGRSNNGTYEIMADGRVCWQTLVSGCFRFYRQDGEIRVRRDDGQSEAELGVVRITPL
ncbi:MAG: hypothetical protein AAF366_00660 [Pseudomonadota bacterium]